MYAEINKKLHIMLVTDEEDVENSKEEHILEIVEIP